MSPLSIFCLVAVLATATTVCARGNSIRDNLKPTEWISPRELENAPSVDEITFEKLQEMPAEEAAELVNQIYHLSQLSRKIEPSYAPSPSDIPVYTYTPTGQRVNTKLNQLVSTVQQQPHFGQQEVTIFITGLPQQKLRDAARANQKLIQAYLQAYNGQVQVQGGQDADSEQDTSSSEESSNSKQTKPSGNLVVIDLGAVIRNFEELVLLDINRVGAAIGNSLVQLTSQTDVPQEVIYIVAQGIGAHVAGAAARQYTRQTGNKLRRITAMDPTKIFARKPNTLVGLARGNADFVDAIHTSAYGLGSAARAGDVDFYPNGPSVAMPGTDNIIEASLRATRYFAETVRPGNDRNFPAVAAESLQQYKNNNGNGRRAYMGIAADYDLEGDYILQVNAKSPFGKSAPAKKQNSYHGIHQTSGRSSSNN
ncbi:vitellogenin-2-like [Bactrocera neohumeralis]|uniref:vitellogenin-2-like n=1 Tax=Bactrocera neohumeralis TaxID=98809 RepID=UPI0021653C56|nr:vitellogenin-2-like [Bactrocera neohumeralis]